MGSVVNLSNTWAVTYVQIWGTSFFREWGSSSETRKQNVCKTENGGLSLVLPFISSMNLGRTTILNVFGPEFPPCSKLWLERISVYLLRPADWRVPTPFDTNIDLTGKGYVGPNYLIWSHLHLKLSSNSMLTKQACLYYCALIGDRECSSRFWLS